METPTTSSLPGQAAAAKGKGDGGQLLQFEGWIVESSRSSSSPRPPVPLAAHYPTGHHQQPTTTTAAATAAAAVAAPVLPPRLLLEASAFDAPPHRRTPKYHFEVPGELLNTNTIEAFHALDKKKQLDLVAAKLDAGRGWLRRVGVWTDIESGEALREPWRLCRFLMLAFSDLKKYRFHYMLAFPALLPARPFTALPALALTDALAPAEVESLRDGYEKLRGLHSTPGEESNPAAAAAQADEAADRCSGHAFFLARRTRTTLESSTDGDQPSTTSITASTTTCIEVAPLHAHDHFWKDVPHADRLVGFADPSSRRTHPGWPLRNFLLLLVRWVCRDMTSVPVICYRQLPGKRNIDSSLVIPVLLPDPAGEALIDGRNLKVAGWEKDSEGKLRPRVVSLADSMDPQKLAGTAVELNLQLMRWRLLPSLDLARVAATRCLLLGAGTLGCNVARNLLGWGVRNITLVDNGLVSYSNPVRQSLFTFEDSLHGGKPKAAAAAHRLQQIFPGVVLPPSPPQHQHQSSACNAVGHRFSIPMPGHAVGEGQREQLVINAALGFDSYVVMRHGLWDRTAAAASPAAAPPLGCYFCNDVVAPQDSLSDRTLDQQCTVTRPGVSYLAGCLAVELLVSLLHHPLGAKAGADVDKDVSAPTESPLGLVPHQVRGYLSHYKNMLVVGHAYDKCTACSDTVVGAYQQYVFNNPTHLEDITGLTQLKQATVDFSGDWEEFDDDNETGDDI
ncbi:autophagy protein, putative [Acanthamoeba castellanii str. Neff]|uniref:Autophagy protein, putative n=1 Tax=Acanthamoeba castellanii (strain ATCC 30010 / Neff) TaxID=1257118 RepID=L8HBH5_ACACF|nr:autophagy protein, putative [Acanthamoeba castellanii str. Neff]ELR22555.1 autophagy protein, putative [Acanthamoeba castellanii str. Neff]